LCASKNSEYVTAASRGAHLDRSRTRRNQMLSTLRTAWLQRTHCPLPSSPHWRRALHVAHGLALRDRTSYLSASARTSRAWSLSQPPQNTLCTAAMGQQTDGMYSGARGGDGHKAHVRVLSTAERVRTMLRRVTEPTWRPWCHYPCIGIARMPRLLSTSMSLSCLKIGHSLSKRVGGFRPARLIGETERTLRVVGRFETDKKTNR